MAARFILLSGGPYVIMTTPNGVLTGIPSHPVTAGDVVVIYTIGLGATTPSVLSGTASPGAPNLATVPTTQLCFGQPSPFSPPPCATAAFAGLTPGLVGLYQINVTIPSGLPTGSVPLYFTVGGSSSDQRTNSDSMTDRLYYHDSYLHGVPGSRNGNEPGPPAYLSRPDRFLSRLGRPAFRHRPVGRRRSHRGSGRGPPHRARARSAVGRNAKLRASSIGRAASITCSNTPASTCFRRFWPNCSMPPPLAFIWDRNPAPSMWAARWKPAADP